MYRFVIPGLFVTLMAGMAFADSQYKPPAVGTQITWQEPSYETAADAPASKTRVSQVVGQGEDFAIYLFDIGYDVEKPTSFFAEFSGIHVTSCATEMPTAKEREDLQRFWPLQTGASLQIGTEETFLTTYEVGRRTVHSVSQIDGDRPAQLISVKEGDFSSDVMLSLDWGMPVLRSYGNGDNVRAIELFSPTIPANLSEADRVALGECAKLLEE